MLAVILFLLSFAPVPRWVKVNDAYFVHKYYVGGYGDLIGDYYQPWKGYKFTAQCHSTDSKPVEKDTEEQARDFVLACPV